ncbi:MAG: YkgJ family cysteine cluster protein [Nitrospiria bacterium]
MLDQLIPTEICLKCDICCRFPESSSFLAPFFTGEEVQKASLYGLSMDFFKEGESGRISLIPFPDEIESPGHNGGCQCPCFDPVSRHCSIYEVRPFDCQIYPFVLMKRKSEVVFGMDTKCPFISDPLNGPQIQDFGFKLARRLESAPYQAFLLKNPDLIGPFQEDVIVLRPLKGLSA